MRPSCRMSIQERNCYCNGPGVWNMNMLQCGKCRRWFHDRCVQCLENAIMFGDKFYVFICSICNSGFEFLGRYELKWADVAHLLLYNLTVIKKRKYFDLNSTMMAFLHENWARMNLLGEVSTCSNEERRRKILQALQENKKSRFKCGKEVKKRRTLWALRERVPPVAPHVVPVPSHREENVTIWEFKVPGRKSKIIYKGKKFTKETDKVNHCTKNGSHTVTENGKSTNKNHDVPKCQNSAVPNGTKKQTGCRIKKQRSVLNEHVCTTNLLDTLIPPLQSYNRVNHPFKNLNSESKGRSNPPSKRRKLNELPQLNQKSLSPLSSLTNGLLKPHLACNKTSSSISDQSTLGHSLRNGKVSFHNTKGIMSRLEKSNGQNFMIRGKRITTDGKIQYLIEWNR